jgi:hypothetical protein
MLDLRQREDETFLQLRPARIFWMLRWQTGVMNRDWRVEEACERHWDNLRSQRENGIGANVGIFGRFYLQLSWPDLRIAPCSQSMKKSNPKGSVLLNSHFTFSENWCKVFSKKWKVLFKSETYDAGGINPRAILFTDCTIAESSVVGKVTKRCCILYFSFAWDWNTLTIVPSSGHRVSKQVRLRKWLGDPHGADHHPWMEPEVQSNDVDVFDFTNFGGQLTAPTEIITPDVIG